MIEVNKLSWHAKVYQWWYFAKWPQKRQYGDRLVSNLCPYVRTVLLWAPFRWLFYQGTVGVVRVPYVAIPLILLSMPQPLGYLSYRVKYVLWMINLGLAGVLVFIGLVCALSMVATWADDRWHVMEKWEKRNRLRKREKNEQWELEYESRRRMPPKGPSFWRMIGHHIAAGHDRICPEIVFKAPDEITGDWRIEHFIKTGE